MASAWELTWELVNITERCLNLTHAMPHLLPAPLPQAQGLPHSLPQSLIFWPALYNYLDCLQISCAAGWMAGPKAGSSHQRHKAEVNRTDFKEKRGAESGDAWQTSDLRDNAGALPCRHHCLNHALFRLKIQSSASVTGWFLSLYLPGPSRHFIAKIHAGGEGCEGH